MGVHQSHTVKSHTKRHVENSESSDKEQPKAPSTLSNKLGPFIVKQRDQVFRLFKRAIVHSRLQLLQQKPLTGEYLSSLITGVHNDS